MVKIVRSLHRRINYNLYMLLGAITPKITTSPHIQTIEETIDKIINDRVSVSRYGDGEFNIMIGNDIPYQKASFELTEKLVEVQQSCLQQHIVCLPDTFKYINAKEVTREFKRFWRVFMGQYRCKWKSYLNLKQVYYNSFLSRPYIAYTDKTKSKELFHKLKRIWDNRAVLIVEGETSRLGVGNDLFDGASSIRRILGPSKEAFEKYDELLKAVKRYEKDCLVLLALGPTATVLAYDLSREGYQAIDIGHVDVEYEWFLMRAQDKVPVKNKYVNEAGKLGGHEVGPLSDEKYLKQIELRII